MTFPTHSRAQLVSMAYARLGLAEVGQPADDEDLAAIDAHVEPLMARLNAEKITYHVDAVGNVTQLDDPEAIPAKAFLDIAILLADAAKMDFGMAALPQDDPGRSAVRLRTVWAVKEATQEEYEAEVTDLDTDTTTIVTQRRNQTLVGEYM